jgi:hypothetical protein
MHFFPAMHCNEERAMQNRILLALGVTLSIGSMAHAGTPLTPAIIGEVDGILSSCAKIDPRDEEKFEKLRRSLVPDDGEHARDHKIQHDSDYDENRKKMERDPSYRTNFIWMQTIFKEMVPAEALKLCKAAI